jgi:hypothetical protein
MNTTTAKIAIAIENEDGTWTDVPELTGAIDWPTLAQSPTCEIPFYIDPLRNREMLDKLHGWCIGQTLRMADHTGETVYEGKLLWVEPARGRFALEVPLDLAYDLAKDGA